MLSTIASTCFTRFPGPTHQQVDCALLQEHLAYELGDLVPRDLHLAVLRQRLHAGVRQNTKLARGRTVTSGVPQAGDAKPYDTRHLHMAVARGTGL